MNWLLPALTFALGLSTSALLLLGWQAFRRNLHEKQRARSDEVHGTFAKHSTETAESANRIEGAASSGRATRGATPVGFENPRRAFHSAFIRGDTEAAIALLPDLEDLLGGGGKHGILHAAIALASAGKKEALPYLLDALLSGEEVGDDQLLQSLVSGAVQYYVSTDREMEGLHALEEVIKGHAYNKAKSKESRAAIANQLQMLYFGSGRGEDALATIDYVIELCPRDPSYYFNKSLILEQLEKLDGAVQAIEKCIELDVHDDKQHLLQALDLYHKVEDPEKIKSTEEKLQA